MKKFFRRALTALLIVAGLLTATIVCAAVQMFDGKGEWHTNDDDNQEIAKSRASQRAQLDAQKKAGVYLKTFSRTVNLELADDEISAVTNNIIEIVGDVQFDKKIVPLSESQTTILYTATLKAKIDPEGIYDFVKRDEKDKVKIVERNNDLQDAIQRNDELAASLTEQYNRATSQAERDQIRKQMNNADREFLSNQKVDEGWKLWYKKDFNGAKNLFDEAINLNPNNKRAWLGRSATYSMMGQNEQARADSEKFDKLNSADIDAFKKNRDLFLARLSNEQGVFCMDDLLKKYEKAIQYFNEALQYNPNYAEAYYNRGLCWQKLGDNAKAQADFAKAKQLGYNG